MYKTKLINLESIKYLRNSCLKKALQFKQTNKELYFNFLDLAGRFYQIILDIEEYQNNLMSYNLKKAFETVPDFNDDLFVKKFELLCKEYDMLKDFV